MREIRENIPIESISSGYEEVEPELESELDSRFSDYLEGKSKEELIMIRNQIAKWKATQEPDATDDSADDGHSEPVLVLKRTLLR